jgi:DNA-binding IclR family transcriptional regulator
LSEHQENGRSLAAPGIQSIEVGADILRALADAGGPVALTRLAQLAAMEPSKARRYLVSFLRCGLVEQDERSGHYFFGPLAFRIGLASFNAMDPIRLGARSLVALRDATGETAMLSVWGGAGPTIVGLEESGQAVMLIARLGAMLPLLSSATGQVFAAFLAHPAIPESLAREWEALPAVRRREILGPHRNVEALLAAVRADRLAEVQDQVQSGIHGFSAPVFSHKGKIVAAVTLITRSGADSQRKGRQLAQEVGRRAAALSQELGYAGLPQPS